MTQTYCSSDGGAFSSSNAIYIFTFVGGLYVQ